MKATCRVVKGKTGTEYSYSFGATDSKFEELYCYIEGEITIILLGLDRLAQEKPSKKHIPGNMTVNMR